MTTFTFAASAEAIILEAAVIPPACVNPNLTISAQSAFKTLSKLS